MKNLILATSCLVALPVLASAQAIKVPVAGSVVTGTTTTTTGTTTRVNGQVVDSDVSTNVAPATVTVPPVAVPAVGVRGNATTTTTTTETESHSSSYGSTNVDGIGEVTWGEQWYALNPTEQSQYETEQRAEWATKSAAERDAAEREWLLQKERAMNDYGTHKEVWSSRRTTVHPTAVTTILEDHPVEVQTTTTGNLNAAGER